MSKYTVEEVSEIIKKAETIETLNTILEEEKADGEIRKGVQAAFDKKAKELSPDDSGKAKESGVKLDPKRVKLADGYKAVGVSKVNMVKGDKIKSIFPINVPTHILAGWDIVKEEK